MLPSLLKNSRIIFPPLHYTYTTSAEESPLEEHHRCDVKYKHYCSIHHPTQKGEVWGKNRFYLQVSSRFSNIICNTLLAIFLAALNICLLQVILFTLFEADDEILLLFKILHTLP